MINGITYKKVLFLYTVYLTSNAVVPPSALSVGSGWGNTAGGNINSATGSNGVYRKHQTLKKQLHHITAKQYTCTNLLH